MGKGGEFFVFDMGQPVKIYDLAKTLIQMSGKDIQIEFSGLRPGEKMYEELIYDKAKDLPTHNPKILICEEKLVCFDCVETLYKAFMSQLDHLDKERIKPALEQLLQDIEKSNEARRAHEQHAVA
jgi:FlaA1/EpsC-like NDP-sugar epimerase